MTRPSDMEVAMMQIELAQLRKGAAIMACHILAEPVVGIGAVSAARRVANDVLAAEAIAITERLRVPT